MAKARVRPLPVVALALAVSACTEPPPPAADLDVSAVALPGDPIHVAASVDSVVVGGKPATAVTVAGERVFLAPRVAPGDVDVVASTGSHEVARARVTFPAAELVTPGEDLDAAPAFGISFADPSRAAGTAVDAWLIAGDAALPRGPLSLHGTVLRAVDGLVSLGLQSDVFDAPVSLTVLALDPESGEVVARIIGPAGTHDLRTTMMTGKVHTHGVPGAIPAVTAVVLKPDGFHVTGKSFGAVRGDVLIKDADGNSHFPSVRSWTDTEVVFVQPNWIRAQMDVEIVLPNGISGGSAPVSVSPRPPRAACDKISPQTWAVQVSEKGSVLNSVEEAGCGYVAGGRVNTGPVRTGVVARVTQSGHLLWDRVVGPSASEVIGAVNGYDRDYVLVRGDASSSLLVLDDDTGATLYTFPLQGVLATPTAISITEETEVTIASDVTDVKGNHDANLSVLGLGTRDGIFTIQASTRITGTGDQRVDRIRQVGHQFVGVGVDDTHGLVAPIGADANVMAATSPTIARTLVDVAIHPQGMVAVGQNTVTTTHGIAYEHYDGTFTEVAKQGLGAPGDVALGVTAREWGETVVASLVGTASTLTALDCHDKGPTSQTLDSHFHLRSTAHAGGLHGSIAGGIIVAGERDGLGAVEQIQFLPPAQVLGFSADGAPSVHFRAGTATLIWTTTNATEVTIERLAGSGPDPVGPFALNGSTQLTFSDCGSNCNNAIYRVHALRGCADDSRVVEIIRTTMTPAQTDLFNSQAYILNQFDGKPPPFSWGPSHPNFKTGDGLGFSDACFAGQGRPFTIITAVGGGFPDDPDMNSPGLMMYGDHQSSSVVGWASPQDTQIPFVSAGGPQSPPTSLSFVAPAQWFLHVGGWHTADSGMTSAPGCGLDQHVPRLAPLNDFTLQSKCRGGAGCIGAHGAAWDVHVYRDPAGIELPRLGKLIDDANATVPPSASQFPDPCPAPPMGAGLVMKDGYGQSLFIGTDGTGCVH